MNNLPDSLELLTERIEHRLDTLERRVLALEHPSLPPAAPLVLNATTPQVLLANDAVPFAPYSGMFSILGKAMLGIAGAYVLRAVAESGALPRLAVAAVAVLYAILWLVAAARVKPGQWLAGITYACTSALILAPMLWELTLRFNVLPPSIAAAVLSAFVLAASALAWKHDNAPVIWVANFTAAVAAIALSIATRDLLPFIATLLLMVLVCEVAAARNHQLGVRPLASAAADLAIWALIFIYSSAPGTRPEYKPLATAALLAPASFLFLIQVVALTLATVLRKRSIAIFETGQTFISFLMMATSLLYFLPVNGAIVLGVLCLLFACASYTAIFIILPGADREAIVRRNLRVYAVWSAALVLIASWLLLPPILLPASLALLAVVASVIGFRRARLTLQIHGLLYLIAAAVAVGLPTCVINALATTIPATPRWNILLVMACAVACYAASIYTHSRAHRLALLIPAALAACATAALLVQTLFSFGIAADAFHIAFIRTLILCALALAMAFAGSRWQRDELNWIAYAVLALVSAKLLFEDLRHGHLAFIAASIFVYAITLIVVSRLIRMGHRI